MCSYIREKSSSLVVVSGFLLPLVGCPGKACIHTQLFYMDCSCCLCRWSSKLGRKDLVAAHKTSGVNIDNCNKGLLVPPPCRFSLQAGAQDCLASPATTVNTNKHSIPSDRAPALLPCLSLLRSMLQEWCSSGCIRRWQRGQNGGTKLPV